MIVPAASGPSVAAPAVDLSIYGHVIHVGWVVKDLDQTLDYWERLGLRNIRRAGVVESPGRTFRGKPVQLKRKMAWGDFGGVEIEAMEPVEGENSNREFLRQHGDGIHHFAYAVASARQLDEQIEYFKRRGVEVVEEGVLPGPKGQGRIAYLDTAAQGGGMVLELVYNPNASPASPSRNETPFTRVAQFALVVRDLKKVSAYYERLGFGGMSIEHNISVNRNYRGRPAQFEMDMGFWSWPDVTFEWIEPTKGPSVYDEFLKSHGEGVHHLGYEVKDLDAAVGLMKSKGAPDSQSGGWENPGGGGGRFAYLDTEPHGGLTIELLWNRPDSR